MGTNTVSGRVVGPDGGPVAGASVMFSRGPVPLPDIAQLTDQQGRFTLATPVEGDYRVLVNAPDAQAVEQDVHVAQGTETSIEVIVGRDP